MYLCKLYEVSIGWKCNIVSFVHYYSVLKMYHRHIV